MTRNSLVCTCVHAYHKQHIRLSLSGAARTFANFPRPLSKHRFILDFVRFTLLASFTTL